MIAIDVNVLIGAHRADAPNHRPYRDWLESLVNGPAPFAAPSIVCSGYVRIVSHPRIFDPPTDTAVALGHMQTLRAQPGFRTLEPGPRHWELFAALCAGTGIKGNLVPDAYLAALAIGAGCRWATADGDFARFAELDWFHPLHT